MEALRESGARVATTSRSAADLPEHHALDLAAEEGRAGLAALIGDLAPVTVIHLAGQMSADDAGHAAGTVAPTAAILDALAARPPRTDDLPDLVLASSLSVYGYAALPDGAQLDELTPLETSPEARDAYARAKLAQEALALTAAQRRGVRVRVLRPGAIMAPGGSWTSRIGLQKGGATVMLGGGAALPLVDVEDCARAFALAATTPMTVSDATIMPGTDGLIEAINVVGDETPSQAQHLAAQGGSKVTVPLPWGALKQGATAAGLAAELTPLSGVLPTLARPEALSARAKPLRYANARAKDRLGWRPSAKDPA